jgi:hypothetical protein
VTSKGDIKVDDVACLQNAGLPIGGYCTNRGRTEAEVVGDVSRRILTTGREGNERQRKKSNKFTIHFIPQIRIKR